MILIKTRLILVKVLECFQQAPDFGIAALIERAQKVHHFSLILPHVDPRISR